ncbi:MAG TPA: hypothetical protein VFT04_08050 [Gemmatimonadales bacterium]|nr:hypothetical protein [Gemmatimonadales bacterium]
MSARFPLVVAAAAMLAAPVPVLAQQWNSPEALALAAAGSARRQEAQADSTLTSYRTRAHGFVFFLAQVGEEGLAQPARLVKADELQVEVYWRAPNQSKQVILGWRDGTFLPTDINYHRDHLGIVTNNFGNLIRIGEGDEVRDVPHPLSPGGLEAYDFAITDSVAVEGVEGSVSLLALSVRPKDQDFSRPLVVGTLYLDAATAQLVRFRFSFTPAAYLDRQLEDITITLQSSLWEGRYWLPYRQEVEIRRRFSWLEFPARGIIQGRWEIEEYDVNAEFPDAVLAGPAIGGLRRTGGPDSLFSEPLAEAIASVARPLDEREMAQIRADIERLAGNNLLSGLPSARIGGAGISDFARVNRVQGLALGGRAVLGLRRNRVQIIPSFGIGTADGRVTGGLTARIGTGATELTAAVSRRVQDFTDQPVIAPVLNSIAAQEFGDDYGDYVRLDAAMAGIGHRIDARHLLSLEGSIERSRSLEVEASPANGTYRPNPALGAGIYRIARLRLERGAGSSVAQVSDLRGSLALEGGDGPTDYLRATVSGRWLKPIGATELLMRASGGVASDGVPAYRAFALGGRGTLVGEPFRAFGGRRALLGHVEWRVNAPVPAIPLGSFASTGTSMVLAPFAAIGWTGGDVAGGVGTASDGARPVLGVAAELFMRLIRVEAGVALRTGEVGVTIDIGRDWWGAL